MIYISNKCQEASQMPLSGHCVSAWISWDQVFGCNDLILYKIDSFGLYERQKAQNNSVNLKIMSQV